jgi:hypothetical protein
MNEMEEKRKEPKDAISLGRLAYLTIAGLAVMFVFVYGTITDHNFLCLWLPLTHTQGTGSHLDLFYKAT